MSKRKPKTAGARATLRLLGALALAGALTATGGAGIAQAKLTGPGGALKGCVDKHGVLHVVAFKAKCPHGDQAIVFGAQGAAGPAGKEGPQGKEGPAGKESAVSALEAKVTALQGEHKTLTEKVSTLEGAKTALEGKLGAIEAGGGAFAAKIGALETTLAGVTRKGSTLTFSGMNLEIDSGSGATAGAVNGLGNLFIGYNEHEGEQTGSNNLVVGEKQTFTSYGGIVAGLANTIGAPFASVTGGQYNIASDSWSSVVGGCDNVAGSVAVPTGPCSNQAEAVLGGASNQASGIESAVSGGQSNRAEATIASVTGGFNNSAKGLGSTITGGYGNFVESGANEAVVTGGGENVASGDVATIAGGYLNKASDDESTVLGGCSNLAGEGSVLVNPKCTEFGNSFQAVVGGLGNSANNLGSTILGGELNVVNGGTAESLGGGKEEDLKSATSEEGQFGKTLFAP